MTVERVKQGIVELKPTLATDKVRVKKEVEGMKKMIEDIEDIVLKHDEYYSDQMKRSSIVKKETWEYWKSSVITGTLFDYKTKINSTLVDCARQFIKDMQLKGKDLDREKEMDLLERSSRLMHGRRTRVDKGRQDIQKRVAEPGQQLQTIGIMTNMLGLTRRPTNLSVGAMFKEHKKISYKTAEDQTRLKKPSDLPDIVTKSETKDRSKKCTRLFQLMKANKIFKRNCLSFSTKHKRTYERMSQDISGIEVAKTLHLVKKYLTVLDFRCAIIRSPISTWISTFRADWKPYQSIELVELFVTFAKKASKKHDGLGELVIPQRSLHYFVNSCNISYDNDPIMKCNNNLKSLLSENNNKKSIYRYDEYSQILWNLLRPDTAYDDIMAIISPMLQKGQYATSIHLRYLLTRFGFNFTEIDEMLSLLKPKSVKLNELVAGKKEIIAYKFSDLLDILFFRKDPLPRTTHKYSNRDNATKQSPTKKAKLFVVKEQDNDSI